MQNFDVNCKYFLFIMLINITALSDAIMCSNIVLILVVNINPVKVHLLNIVLTTNVFINHNIVMQNSN